MRKLLTTTALAGVLLLAAWGTADAQPICVGNAECNNVSVGGAVNTNTNVNTNQNVNNNTAVAIQGQKQKQVQFQGQGQGQSQSANNEGNSQSISVAAREREAFGPSLGGMASGPCTGIGGGLSIGFAGAAGALQGTAMDDECTKRENIRIVNMIDPELAKEMLNDLEGVKAARDRIAKRNAPKTAETSPTATPAVTTAAVKNRPAWCEGASPSTNSQYNRYCK